MTATIKAGLGNFNRAFDLLHEISFKDVLRYDHVRKFGTNPDVDATPDEDIWDQGGAYVSPSDTGEAMSVASSDINDANGGTGAESVIVIGLDANGLTQRITKTLNGRTAVALGTFSRVFRAFVLGSQINVGDIYVGNGTFTTGVPTNKFAKILIGNGQTQMAIFTVPSNMEGSLLEWNSSVHGVGTKSSEVTLMYRVSGGVLTVKDNILLAQNGRRYIERGYKVGDYLPAFTDVLVRANSNDADLIIHGGFTILLRELTIPSIPPVKGFAL